MNVGLTTPFAAPASAPAVKVSGNKLVNAAGATVQLRGVNVSGLEFNVINQPQAPPGGKAFDYWGGQNPSLAALQTWKINAVRLPLNEQCYLNETCYNAPSVPLLADPLNSYRGLVKATVDELTAAGMAVILDLHKNAPKATISGSVVQLLSNTSGQSEFSDADNSLAFWTSVASDYQNYPNVIFDLFNEPHIDHFLSPATFAPNPGTTLPAGTNQETQWVWAVLRDGGTGQAIYGDNEYLTQNYQAVGMQAMLNAVRAVGATNVVMAAGISWAQDTSLWTEYCPIDPLKQLACSWHAYPSAGNPAAPGFPNNFVWAATILAAGYPIIIGETGDTLAAPSQWLTTTLLPWADANEVSVMAWSWNKGWGSPCLLNSDGSPTAGEGAAFQTWCVNHP